MKRLLSVLLALVLLISVIPFGTAAEDTTDTETELLWEYEAYGDGVMLTAYTGSAADVYVPSYIEDGDNKYTVLKLGDSIFENNDSLNSVTLGTGILEIGNRAFYDCDNMVCILLAEETTTIGNEVFYSCDSFNSVILYDAVTSIGTNAFTDCPNLTVWCNEGTAGYTYVTENNIPYEILNPEATPETYVQDGITYYIMNGEAIPIGCDETITEVTVPAFVNDYPVTQLRGTFKNCSNLSNVILSDNIKIIDDYSFAQCTALKEINLPNNVNTIGDKAFEGCSSLASITIPNSVTSIGYSAFSGCTQLKQIEIPFGVTEISDYTFRNCYKLESVILPESILSIGYSAFSQCLDLTEINIPNSVVFIDGYAFSNCALINIEIPDSVTSIGDAIFKDCNNLKSVVLPKNLTIISGRMFYNCSNITSITIPNSVTTIESGAFDGCASLQKLIIPNTVTIISQDQFSDTFNINTVLLVYENSVAHKFAVNQGLIYYLYDGTTEPEITTVDGIIYVLINNSAIAMDYVGDSTEIIIPEEVNGFPVTELKGTFKNCQNLVSVVLPKSIKKIGYESFYNCRNLTQISIPDGVVTISGYAFYNCYNLTTIQLNNTITSIGEYAFSRCEKLQTINLPTTVKGIGVYAFSYCYSLSEIIIPEGITMINQSAFLHCESLTKIIIPNSVTDIHLFAFSGCESLNEVVIPEGVQTIGQESFSNCPLLYKVVLPKSITNVRTDSFPKTTVLMVYEDTRSYNLAVNNDLLYFIYDGIIEPEIYTIDGVTYYVKNAEAIAIDCDNSLQEVKVLESVENRPVTELRETFRDCENLVSVSLPESLITIGDYAFSKCTKLKDINIPDNVTSIGRYAFHYCGSLTSVIIPDGITTISAFSFYYSGLSSVEIPFSVTVIDSYAFTGCKNLAELKMSDSVTQINSGAFNSCTALKQVSLSESLLTIKNSAFGGCTELEELIIPNGVNSIESGAFNSTKIKKVIIPESVLGLSETSFSQNTILMVYGDSYAHTFAQENNLLYFVMRKTENPEISYGAGISGTVTYTDGSVASGATVEIVYDDGVSKEIVTTDENGTYEFTYAEVGRYTVRVTDSDNNTVSSAVSVKRMNVFDVFVTGDTDLTLKKGYTLSGTVNIGGANVTITDKDGNIINSVTADENGNFTIVNVPNGEYIVKAETENGSIAKEVTVFDGDISNLELEIETNTASISGYVEVEDRDFKHHRRNWVQVTVYNEDGIAIAQCKTDKDGKYTFDNLPLGEYVIVAETSEMRPDKKHGFDRSHTLTGFAYIEITESKTYEVDTIVLYEENDCKADIIGKVTAKGSAQISEVTLSNVFGDEIDSVTTKNNGKFIFKNVKDGMYFITAVTESGGMGFAVVVVRNGNVYGDTHIKIEKHAHIKEREDKFHADFDDICDKESALKHKERIAQEKRYYDGLSKKEKKQLSKHYREKLDQLSRWISDCEYTSSEDVSFEQGGLVVSGDEITNENNVTFKINVTKTDTPTISTDGVNTNDDFINHSINDKAGKNEIKQYYEITMTKTTDGVDKAITSVYKDTDANGKFRITITIPEEHRGYKHYSFVHEHHGEVVTLCDLDDDPNTVTFEIDKFSTFVLTATNEEQGDSILTGDLNLDGIADTEDFSIMRKVLLDIEKGKSQILNDVNCDETVSICDLVSLDEAI